MAGEELLLVEAVDKDREGLRRYFDQKGYVCNAVRSSTEAREVIAQKFFPAALVDLDLETPSGGLEVVRLLRERSRETGVILLTNRRSFEGALAALRLGVQDVIIKAPDQIEYMRQAVEIAASRYKAKDHSADLYREFGAVMNDALKVMIEMSRKVYADISMAAPPIKPTVLFVDGDGEFLHVLAPLVQKEGWNVLADTNGGAALDHASRERIDILVVRNELPDLRGSMVVKSIQAENTEVLALLYTAPGPQGRIDRIDRGQVEAVIKPFASPQHLLDAVRKLTGELATKAMDRRLIQAFRDDHKDFFRRFAKVKSQVDNLIED